MRFKTKAILGQHFVSPESIRPITDGDVTITRREVSNNQISSLDKINSVKSWAKQKTNNAFSRKTLKKRFPICTWLPTYDTSCFLGDLVAGITVGLTIIPQALAYANFAGIPPQYGLYTSFLGCLLYIFIGGSKDVAVGPTAIVSLITHDVLHGNGHEHATLLCFLTGVIQLLMGIFGLGFLIDFVSGPVSLGFTSAGAIVIVASQIKDILGVRGSGTTFIESCSSLVKEIKNTNVWDAGLGISCIIVLFVMKIVSGMRLGPKGGEEKLTRFQRIANKSIWLLGTARSAIIVVLTGIIGYAFSQNGESRFKLIGHVPSGLPNVQLPPFGYEEIIHLQNATHNTTHIEYHSLKEMLFDLGSGIIVVPLVGLLENIAICKVFADGKPIDATQEFLAIGFCNLANSFVQAFPGGGSLSRSPVNHSSGVKTPLGGLYTGILVILALLFFTPWFYFIPKCALAAIIIAAVVYMVEVKVIRPMWKTKRSDLILCLTTFVACLCLQLQIGILVGIGINLLFILYHAARPKITIEKLQTNNGTEYLMITPDRCLIFPSSDYMRNLVTKHSVREGIPVVINCSYIYGADYTAATVIETLTNDFSKRNQILLFYNLKPSVSSVFEGLSPKDFVVFYKFDDIDEILAAMTNNKEQENIENV